MKVKHLVGAFLCVLGCYACSSPKTEVQSPDGHIKMTLTVDENGKPFYNVSVDDSLLIENSAMGFTAANGIILSEGFQVKNTTFSSEDETWTQPWGENKKNRNHYNEMAVSLTNEDQVQLTLRFRVFDDGIGFRYEYTVPTVDSLLITDELTTFRFHRDGTSWSIPAVPKHMNYSINNNRFPKWKRLIHLSHSRLRMEFTEVYTKPLCMIFRK